MIEKQVVDSFQRIATQVGAEVPKEMIDKGIKDSIKANEDVLKIAKKSRIKFVAGGAVALTAIYLGCKAIFGKNKNKL